MEHCSKTSIEPFTKVQTLDITIIQAWCFRNKIVTRSASIRLSIGTIKNSQALKNYSNRYNRYNLIQSPALNQSILSKSPSRQNRLYSPIQSSVKLNLSHQAYQLTQTKINVVNPPWTETYINPTKSKPKNRIYPKYKQTFRN